MTWYYHACKKCYKKVNETTLIDDTDEGQGDKHIFTCRSQGCKNDEIVAVPKYLPCLIFI